MLAQTRLIQPNFRTLGAQRDFLFEDSFCSAFVSTPPDLRSFLNQYSRPFSILGSALIFGVAHTKVCQFVAGLGAGIVLGWLYERTRVTRALHRVPRVLKLRHHMALLSTLRGR